MENKVNNLICFGIDQRYVKIFEKQVQLLNERLTHSEIATLLLMSNHLCYDDCSLHKNGRKNGTKLNGKDLSEIIDIPYNTLRKVISKFLKEGLIYIDKKSNSDVTIYINPYVICRGAMVQEDILYIFSNTILANIGTKDNSIDVQLSNSFRGVIDKWKQESMRFCDYKCVVTGENFDEIHHIIPYNIIVKNTLEKHNYDINVQYSSIDKATLKLIKNEILSYHDLYGYGACLSKPVHQLYHSIYGNINCNHSNFIEFLLRIQNAEYSEYFKMHDLDININSTYLSYLKSLDSIYKCIK